MLSPDARNYYGFLEGMVYVESNADVAKAVRLARSIKVEEGERMVLVLFRSKKGGEDG